MPKVDDPFVHGDLFVVLNIEVPQLSTSCGQCDDAADVTWRDCAIPGWCLWLYLLGLCLSLCFFRCLLRFRCCSRPRALTWLKPTNQYNVRFRTLTADVDVHQAEDVAPKQHSFNPPACDGADGKLCSDPTVGNSSPILKGAKEEDVL